MVFIYYHNNYRGVNNFNNLKPVHFVFPVLKVMCDVRNATRCL